MLSFFIAAILAAPAEPVPGAWTFHDAERHGGRSLVALRPLELADRPVRPLADGDRPAGARYGLLPVGSLPEAHRAVVWLPDAADGPRVWVDGDGDGRFAPAERHALGKTPLAIPVLIQVDLSGKTETLSRTILLRRTAAGGLAYAVRGYAAGRLALGGEGYDALLADANADGRFDSPGGDRVWVDLDRDGAFDPLTEQFPLGTPLPHAGRAYLLRPDPLGRSVAVRERPAEQGTLRLTLADQGGLKPQNFQARLVSDWGELVTVRASGEAVALPVGRYGIGELTFRLPESGGRVWSYRFWGTPRLEIVVAPGKETAAAVLAGLELGLRHTAPAAGVTPGQDVQVTPFLRARNGLELINAEFSGPDGGISVGAHADVRLTGAGGKVVDQTASGFQ